MSRRCCCSSWPRSPSSSRCGGSPSAPACRPPRCSPLVGIVYALLPGPNVTLDPDLVLTLVIPPLLYSAALDSSLLAIRRNLRTVVSLSVLLVLATAVLIGIGFALFVAGRHAGRRHRAGRRGRPAGPGRRARRSAARSACRRG